MITTACTIAIAVMGYFAVGAKVCAAIRQDPANRDSLDTRFGPATMILLWPLALFAEAMG